MITDEMIRRAHGYDDSQLVTDWDAKSMGVSTTLLEDVTDYEEIRGVFRSLSKDLSSRMKTGCVQVSYSLQNTPFHPLCEAVEPGGIQRLCTLSNWLGRGGGSAVRDSQRMGKNHALGT